MDINPQTTSAISDDQELAKVLAGVNQQNDEPLQFDTPPIVTTPMAVPPPQPVDPTPATTPAVPAMPVMPTPTTSMMPPVNPSGDLDSIKNDALKELRPLVDKLDLAPQEKFDTYLLLLRSTDDKTLIAPAHIAAQSITDETKKAQALLDIIKEIDYFSSPKQ